MRPAFEMNGNDGMRIQHLYGFQQILAVHGVLPKTAQVAKLRRSDMKNTDIDLVAPGYFPDSRKKHRIAGNL